jgi:hypothetical protein
VNFTHTKTKGGDFTHQIRVNKKNPVKGEEPNQQQTKVALFVSEKLAFCENQIFFLLAKDANQLLF